MEPPCPTELRQSERPSTALPSQRPHGRRPGTVPQSGPGTEWAPPSPIGHMWRSLEDMQGAPRPGYPLHAQAVRGAGFGRVGDGQPHLSPPRIPIGTGHVDTVDTRPEPGTPTSRGFLLTMAAQLEAGLAQLAQIKGSLGLASSGNSPASGMSLPGSFHAAGLRPATAPGVHKPAVQAATSGNPVAEGGAPRVLAADRPQTASGKWTGPRPCGGQASQGLETTWTGVPSTTALGVWEHPLIQQALERPESRKARPRGTSRPRGTHKEGIHSPQRPEEGGYSPLRPEAWELQALAGAVPDPRAGAHQDPQHCDGGLGLAAAHRERTRQKLEAVARKSHKKEGGETINLPEGMVAVNSPQDPPQNSRPGNPRRPLELGQRHVPRYRMEVPQVLAPAPAPAPQEPLEPPAGLLQHSCEAGAVSAGGPAREPCGGAVNGSREFSQFGIDHAKAVEILSSSTHEMTSDPSQVPDAFKASRQILDALIDTTPKVLPASDDPALPHGQGSLDRAHGGGCVRSLAPELPPPPHMDPRDSCYVEPPGGSLRPEVCDGHSLPGASPSSALGLASALTSASASASALASASTSASALGSASAISTASALHSGTVPQNVLHYEDEKDRPEPKNMQMSQSSLEPLYGSDPPSCGEIPAWGPEEESGRGQVHVNPNSGIFSTCDGANRSSGESIPLLSEMPAGNPSEGLNATTHTTRIPVAATVEALPGELPEVLPEGLPRGAMGHVDSRTSRDMFGRLESGAMSDSDDGGEGSSSLARECNSQQTQHAPDILPQWASDGHVDDHVAFELRYASELARAPGYLLSVLSGTSPTETKSGYTTDYDSGTPVFSDAEDVSVRILSHMTNLASEGTTTAHVTDLRQKVSGEVLFGAEALCHRTSLTVPRDARGLQALSPASQPHEEHEDASDAATSSDESSPGREHVLMGVGHLLAVHADMAYTSGLQLPLALSPDRPGPCVNPLYDDAGPEGVRDALQDRHLDRCDTQGESPCWANPERDPSRGSSNSTTSGRTHVERVPSLSYVGRTSTLASESGRTSGTTNHANAYSLQSQDSTAPDGCSSIELSRTQSSRESQDRGMCASDLPHPGVLGTGGRGTELGEQGEAKDLQVSSSLVSGPLTSPPELSREEISAAHGEERGEVDGEDRREKDGEDREERYGDRREEAGNEEEEVGGVEGTGGALMSLLPSQAGGLAGTVAPGGPRRLSGESGPASHMGSRSRSGTQSPRAGTSSGGASRLGDTPPGENPPGSPSAGDNHQGEAPPPIAVEGFSLAARPQNAGGRLLEPNPRDEALDGESACEGDPRLRGLSTGMMPHTDVSGEEPRQAMRASGMGLMGTPPVKSGGTAGGFHTSTGQCTANPSGLYGLMAELDGSVPERTGWMPEVDPSTSSEIHAESSEDFEASALPVCRPMDQTVSERLTQQGFGLSREYQAPEEWPGNDSWRAAPRSTSITHGHVSYDAVRVFTHCIWQARQRYKRAVANVFALSRQGPPAALVDTHSPELQLDAEESEAMEFCVGTPPKTHCTWGEAEKPPSPHDAYWSSPTARVAAKEAPDTMELGQATPTADSVGPYACTVQGAARPASAAPGNGEPEGERVRTQLREPTTPGSCGRRDTADTDGLPSCESSTSELLQAVRADPEESLASLGSPASPASPAVSEFMRGCPEPSGTQESLASTESLASLGSPASPEALAVPEFPGCPEPPRSQKFPASPEPGGIPEFPGCPEPWGSQESTLPPESLGVHQTNGSNQFPRRSDSMPDSSSPLDVADSIGGTELGFASEENEDESGKRDRAARQGRFEEGRVEGLGGGGEREQTGEGVEVFLCERELADSEGAAWGDTVQISDSVPSLGSAPPRVGESNGYPEGTQETRAGEAAGGKASGGSETGGEAGDVGGAPRSEPAHQDSKYLLHATNLDKEDSNGPNGLPQRPWESGGSAAPGREPLGTSEARGPGQGNEGVEGKEATGSSEESTAHEPRPVWGYGAILEADAACDHHGAAGTVLVPRDSQVRRSTCDSFGGLGTRDDGHGGPAGLWEQEVGYATGMPLARDSEASEHVGLWEYKDSLGTAPWADDGAGTHERVGFWGHAERQGASLPSALDSEADECVDVWGDKDRASVPSAWGSEREELFQSREFPDRKGSRAGSDQGSEAEQPIRIGAYCGVKDVRTTSIPYGDADEAEHASESEEEEFRVVA
eukprot:jgi/Botrbrau1/5057/Bobra.37_1s0022.1